MRALAVDPDVVVVVSAMWQTTCTAIRWGEEGFLIDSPVLPDELDTLPSLMVQAAFPVSGLLVTHGDWDHLLGRLAFPEATLGAGESTARRLATEPGAAQRALRAFDEEHYIEGPRPLGLSGVQALPVPGKLSIGADGTELELHPAGGHSEDGTIFWLPWLSVLDLRRLPLAGRDPDDRGARLAGCLLGHAEAAVGPRRARHDRDPRTRLAA